MSDTVRITVAPGCFVTITPHPSGVPALRSLTLGQGNTANVAPARAAALLRAGLILDPATGALPPSPEPMRDAAMGVTINGLAPRSTDSGVITVEPVNEALVLPASPVEPSPVGNHDHGQIPRPSVTYGARHPTEMASITTADGREWPTY